MIISGVTHSHTHASHQADLKRVDIVLLYNEHRGYVDPEGGYTVIWCVCSSYSPYTGPMQDGSLVQGNIITT